MVVPSFFDTIFMGTIPGKTHSLRTTSGPAKAKLPRKRTVRGGASR